MQVVQFLHAAIAVSNLAKSEHFYGTVLGLEKLDRALRFPGAWYQIGAFQIHLIAATEPVDDALDLEKWGRNRHLALAVANLEAAKEKLANNGCEFQSSASGRAALFVKDPDGNIIELGEL